VLDSFRKPLCASQEKRRKLSLLWTARMTFTPGIMTHLPNPRPERSHSKAPFQMQTDELKARHCMEPTRAYSRNAPTKTYALTIALRIPLPRCCRFRQFPQHLFVRLSHSSARETNDLAFNCYAASPRTELAQIGRSSFNPQAHLAFPAETASVS